MEQGAYEVTAKKVTKGEFGFDICYDETNQHPGYYVSRMGTPQQVVIGQVTPGDRILAVNGNPVSDLNPLDVMDLVCESPDVCTLRIQPGPFYLHTETRLKGSVNGRLEAERGGTWIRGVVERDRQKNGVHVRITMKKVDGALGFNISSFAKSDGRMEAKRYYVSAISSPNAAQHVCIGDEILSINGTATRGRSHREVVEMFIRSKNTCTLEVYRSRLVAPQELSEETQVSCDS